MKWTLPLCSLLLMSDPLSASPEMIWDRFSDPEIMSYHFSRTFRDLPLQGKVLSENKYWSGGYWALNKGNINFRWYGKNRTGHNLNSPSLETTKKMTIPELAQLSPSEKYDLFTGRYDYPLVKEVSKIADPTAMNWEGICHGWSPASMNHSEPEPKLVTNPDGLEIPFGSTDIKALLSYYYAYAHKAPDTHQMGRRCFRKPSKADKDCGDDMNAGAFHIVLANRIGLDQKGLIADLQRFEEVWNHPITSYRSMIVRETLPSTNAAPGSMKQLEVKTIITYVDENGNDWRPVLGTVKQAYETLTYQYRLDVNREGVIVGGEWISRERPDFLWIMGRPREFHGILSRLPELLNDE
jgi:Transglutaminase elicitor